MARTRKSAAPQGAVAVAEPPEFDFEQSFQSFNDDPQKFFEFVNAYPRKSDAVAYLYRLKPVIRRTPSYIDVFPGKLPLNLQLIEQRWGWGQYHIKFNDQSKPEGLQQVARVKFSIDDPALDPVLEWKELDFKASDNQLLIQRWRAKGIIPADYPKEEAVPGDANAKLADAALEVIKRDREIEPRAPADPLSAKLMEKLVDRVLNEPKPPAEKSDPMMSRLMDLLFKRLEQAEKLTTPDPFAHYERVNNMLAQRAPAASGSFDWGGFFSGLAVFLPVAAPMLKSFITPPAPRPAAAPAGQVIDIGRAPEVQPAAVPPDAPPAVQPVVASESASTETGEGMASMLSKLKNIPGLPPIGELQAIVEQGMAAFVGGVRGYNFAAGMCALDGTGDRTKLLEELAGMGSTQIVGVLGMFPQVADQIGPDKMAELKAWIDDFCTYFAENHEDEQADGEATHPS